jgi:hypothetical protein
MGLSAAFLSKWGISMAVALYGSVEVFGLQNSRVRFVGIERKVDQIALQKNNCDNSSKQLTEEEGFIMGYGGALTLVNGSPFDWVVSSAPSYQMSTWSWPQSTQVRQPTRRILKPGIDTRQGKRQEYMSSMAQRAKQETMQARLITMLQAHQTSFQYWPGSLQITNSQSPWIACRQSRVRKGQKSI